MDKDLLLENMIANGDEQGIYIHDLLTKHYRRPTAPVPDVDAAWQQLQRRRSSGAGRRRMRWAVAAAAIILVIVGLWQLVMPLRRDDAIALEPENTTEAITLGDDAITTLDATPTLKVSNDSRWSLSRWQTIKVPRGRSCKVILPDGTAVTMNAESQLSYLRDFSGDKREVRLKGEAYFQVHHDARRPFTVKVGEMQITVLGTEFMVNGYSAKHPEVTLLKGSVRFQTDDEGSDHVLRPGEQGSIDAQGNAAVSEGDVYAVTQWLDGYFYFDDASVIDVLVQLGRWYNMGVRVENQQAVSNKVHFSASREESITDAIDGLNAIQPAHISINGKWIIVK